MTKQQISERCLDLFVMEAVIISIVGIMKATVDCKQTNGRKMTDMRKPRTAIGMNQDVETNDLSYRILGIDSIIISQG